MIRCNHQDRARLADLIAGAFLFFATAGFVLWQNMHLTVLWDLSYILENATRISLGQIPYRDFPFPYAPLTFVVQAAIIKLFGRSALNHYLYAAASAGFASLLTWRILLRLLASSRMPSRVSAFLLALPLIFLGTSSIFPHPFYDSDCTLFILICVWLILRLESAGFPPAATFACGILLAFPLFIKQNTGLAFLLSAAVCIGWLAIRKRHAVLLLAGAATGVAVALSLIQLTAGLGNYFHWTIRFAASRRLPGVASMLGVYQDPALLWSYLEAAAGLVILGWRTTLRPVFRWAAAALLSLPFLWAFAALFVREDTSDRAEALLHLWPVLLIASFCFAAWQILRAASFAQSVPLILLGSIHGAFLSQQLWGSTYALWPMLVILLAGILAALAGRVPESDATLADAPSPVPLVAFTAVASVVLLITGACYALSHERLEYADLSGETLFHSSLPPLRGLAMRGDWLPNFEELVDYTNREISRGDAILMLPGEDLFYFTTGRTPQFPVLMLDNTVNPYSSGQLVEFARQRNVKWLIIKRTLQLQEEPISFRTQLLEALGREFELTESLSNYDVYRRRSE